MLLELIFNLIKKLLLFIVNALPAMPSIDIPNNLVDKFTNICTGVSYFLPMESLLAIFGIWVTYKFVIINWKVIQRVWDALPFT